MTVRIERYETSATVYVDRIGLAGFVDKKNNQDKYRFRYVADTWMRLTCAENSAVQEAVKDVVVLMNVTQRLKG